MKLNIICSAFLISYGLFHPTTSRAAITLPSGFTDTKIAGGMNPTTMMFAPDGRLFVNEKDGKIRVIKNGQLLPTPFATVEANSSSERGLLGIAFDPDFSNNHFVYVYYTAKAPQVHNRVSRFKANGDVAAGAETIIFELPNLDKGNHNGGTIHFGKDGKLYIASGNNAVNEFSQSNTTTLGKMLRINADGSIPDDNPFGTSVTGQNRAIWALGFRNPYTFAIQPGTGRIFVDDVGGSTWEEISELSPGMNYGWPSAEGNGGTPPSGPGTYKAPVLTYSHKTGDCAISGGTFFNPPQSTFPSQYEGQYFYADYCGGWIKAANPAKNFEVTNFATGLAAPINLQVSPDGQLYYITRGNSDPGSAASSGTTIGEVHRIKGPASVNVKGPDAAKAQLTRKAVFLSGAVELKWPAAATKAVVFDLSGRQVGILRKLETGHADGATFTGLYHLRYLP